MSEKKKNEFREKDYSRNSEGLKQRRLKDESRWRFNPNQTYEETDESLGNEEETFWDSDQDQR